MKNKVIDYRKQFGYSQDKLAEKLGVSRQTIISIEKGKYNFPFLWRCRWQGSLKLLLKTFSFWKKKIRNKGEKRELSSYVSFSRMYFYNNRQHLAPYLL